MTFLRPFSVFRALHCYTEAFTIRVATNTLHVVNAPATVAGDPRYCGANLLKLMGDIQRKQPAISNVDAQASLEHSRRIRIRTKTLQTNEGVALLTSLGTLYQQEGNLDAALTSFAEAIQIVVPRPAKFGNFEAGMLLSHVGAVYEQRAAADDVGRGNDHHDCDRNGGSATGDAREDPKQPVASQTERGVAGDDGVIFTIHPGNLFEADTSNRHAALLSYSLAKPQFQIAIQAGNADARSDLASVYRRLQGLRRGAECTCRNCVLQQQASSKPKTERRWPRRRFSLQVQPPDTANLVADHSDTAEDAVLCRDMGDLCYRMEIDNLQNNFLHGFGWVTAHSTDLNDALTLYKEEWWLRTTTINSTESAADADLLALIADVQLELNDPTGALGHLEKAKQIRIRAGGLMSNDGAALLHGFGHAFVKSGDRSAALAAYREALQARIESQTLNCESGALLYRDIAAVEWKLGNLGAAIEALDAAYRIRKVTETIDTPECIDLLTDCATLHRELGNDVGALELLYAAKTIARRINRDDPANELIRKIQDVSCGGLFY